MEYDNSWFDVYWWSRADGTSGAGGESFPSAELAYEKFKEMVGKGFGASLETAN